MMEFSTRLGELYSGIEVKFSRIIEGDYPPNYCCQCGAEVWPLKGTDVLTCKRGHHQPDLWRS